MILGLVGAACLATGGHRGGVVPAAVRELADEAAVRVAAFTPTTLPPTIEGIDCILVTVPGWREPELAIEPAVVERLRQFVERGGHLVLLGYAAALATDLGFEPERPELEALRWGFDARTVAGRAELGVEVVSGRYADLFDGLQNAPRTTPGLVNEFTFFLAGGAPCCTPLCAWSVGAPRSGAVIARLAAEFDGQPSVGPPVAVAWPHGRGVAVALGLAPDLENDDAVLQRNARRLLQNLMGGLPGANAGDAATSRADRTVALLTLPGADTASNSGSQPAAPAGETAPRAELPMTPTVAHWGWSTRLESGDDPGLSRSLAELANEVIAPSWAAGADLLELVVTDPDHGSPLAWADRDALRRPAGYRGDAFGGQFDAHAFGVVATEAHGRGMLAHGFFDAPPHGERTNERLASLRFFARELADWRRLGDRALDGFGLREWFVDRAGYSKAMVQDLHPAAELYRVGERAPAIAGSVRVLDAEDGALRGLGAAGVSSDWRDGFPADLFPFGVLDARVERPLPSAFGPTYGGGSFGDWIVTQANDFVRPRRGRGAAMWWRHHDPATLGSRGLEYVHGISLDPLRAAVATQCAATGRNGYRAAIGRLDDATPAGFGGELPVPAAVHLLQNNWFRLLGSGGGLLFDPTGEARFRPGEGVVVSPQFLHTRLHGGRPSASSIRSYDVDFLAPGLAPVGRVGGRVGGRSGVGGERGSERPGERGGPSGYGRTSVVGDALGQARRLPATIAFDEQPRWPQRVHLEETLATGYYELDIELRAVRRQGVLAIGLDGTLLHCEPFSVQRRSPALTVPVHVAVEGVRTLELAVLEGGAVALDRLRLVRRGDVAAEAEVAIAAGHVAEVVERSASSYHAETVDLRTIGDFPGFLLRLRCERAVRNLRVERAFGLRDYDGLTHAAEPATRLRRPFALRSSKAGLPDLVVVPLQLARYDHFRFEAGRLTMHSAPETGSESRIGFWLAPRGEGRALAVNVKETSVRLRAVDQPMLLELGDRGVGTLMQGLTTPWTRLLRVHTPSSPAGNTPFMVRENGWWTWRGAQFAPDAGAGAGRYLRVFQAPGDTIEVVGGPAVLARTRPGPGALRILALRDPAPGSVTARVLQPGRLAPPCVVMARDFDAVTVNGATWSWFDGRTVYLPDRPGEYRIETSTRNATAPHVACTGAPLVRCEYDEAARELLLVTAAVPERPTGLPYTAVLRGPRPSAIENGVIVSEDELPHQSAITRSAAAAGGVLVRFAPGVTKVTYAN